MLSSLGLLLLAFPVEGILIPQLGSDVFDRRESAQRALTSILRDTNGFTHYSILLAVRKARNSKDPEISLRAKSIYGACYHKYYCEHDWLCILFERGKDENWDKKTNEKIKQICFDAFGTPLTGVRWEKSPLILLGVYRMPQDIDSVKLKRLRANKKVISVVPLGNVHRALDLLRR